MVAATVHTIIDIMAILPLYSDNSNAVINVHNISQVNYDYKKPLSDILYMCHTLAAKYL